LVGRANWMCSHQSEAQNVEKILRKCALCGCESWCVCASIWGGLYM